MSSNILPQSRLSENEEENVVVELQYAGVTLPWLRSTVTTLSLFALVNARKKYKAAVKIQSLVRGWKTRHKINIFHKSAIKIQKTFRGFLGRMRYFRILELNLEHHILKHYHDSAVKIQAAFRGHCSRKYIHDQIRLKNLQIKAAQELLYCVAVKSRELVKNQQLPGVYSLRNSRCLSKVEKLMASLRIKLYNENVREARTAEISKLNKAFEKASKSKERTEFPFGTICSGKQPGKKKTTYYKLVNRNVKKGDDEESYVSDLSFNLYKNRKKSTDYGWHK